MMAEPTDPPAADDGPADDGPGLQLRPFGRPTLAVAILVGFAVTAADLYAAVTESDAATAAALVRFGVTVAAVFACGITLLGVAVWLARTAARTDQGDGTDTDAEGPWAAGVGGSRPDSGRR